MSSSVTSGAIDEQAAISDAELVRAAQAGDRQALASLLERHYDWLVSLLTLLACDREMASDVAQNAMLAALRQIGAVRDRDAFRPWLYSVAASHLMTERRKHRRQAVSLDELLARFPWRRELVAGDARIERYADREAVHDALDLLHPADRELLLLRHVAGFSGVEVAQILGITPDAARQRISRATQRYQRCLAAPPVVARLTFETDTRA